MALNINEKPEVVQEKFVGEPKDSAELSASEPIQVNPVLRAARSITTLAVHIMIGIITGVSLLFALKDGVIGLNATSLHIILSVIGYQFLMAEAILSLAPDSWLSTLSVKHKHWIHGLMQVTGFILALAGFIIKVLDNTAHFNTTHGKSGLMAFSFSAKSVLSGVISFFFHKNQGPKARLFSKLSHFWSGIVTIVAASISLAYGFHMANFRDWASNIMANVFIIMTLTFTTILIINPLNTFFINLKTIKAIKK